MKLVLKNNVDKKEYEFNVTDQNTSSMFYQFELTLDGTMPEGDYSYLLYKSNKVVASGLARLGDFIPENTKTYNNNPKITYKVYDGE